MIFDQNAIASVITQEKVSVTELVKKISVLYPKFNNNNIIVVIKNIETLTQAELVAFTELSNKHKALSHSFIIVSNKIDLNTVSSSLVVVPTMQEAYDTIEIEDMERDLGL